MAPQNKTSIAHVGRKIAALTGRLGPSHQRVYDLVLRRAVPAEFVAGRWYIEDADVPLVAQALGIPLPAGTSVAA